MSMTASLLLLAFVSSCPFCNPQGQTFSSEVNSADFILYGTLTNPQRDPNDFLKGTTDLAIDAIIKGHPLVDGKTQIRLPRLVPVDPKAAETKFLIFGSIYSRASDTAAAAVGSSAVLADPRLMQIDPYRGEPFRADSKVPEYFKGAIAVRQKDPATRLNFFFKYLDDSDLVISTDAYSEFGTSDYKDVRAVSEKLNPDMLLKWLKNPNTPVSRMGLYSLMLGHCGKATHAAELRSILDNPERALSSGLDGLLAAYILLDPKAGWSYLEAILRDAKKEFPVRYAGLKVLRFFWDYRSDVITQKEVVNGMKLLVEHSDMADLPIEDLRKWEQWKETDFVLKFVNKQEHNNIPIVRRSILRFALAAPKSYTAAKAYVEQIRKEDPDRVKFVEQTLEDEKPRSESKQDVKQ